MSDEQEPYDPTSMAGVPEHGRERLERMRDRSLFTSDLTVNEFLLVRAAGFEPLGLVVGTSIYHIGFQMGAWSRNQEMDVLTQAMYHARELAMTRMEEEADQLGADGIVARPPRGQPPRLGQRPRRVRRHRHGRAPPRGRAHRAPNGRPFTSDLSGQDFYTLLSGRLPAGRHGHGHLRLPRRPPGPADVDAPRRSATSRCPTSPRRSTTPASWRWSACRPRPRRSRPRASSGVQLVEGNHGWGAHVLEYFSVGTAVIPTSDTHEIPPPTLTLTLNDSRQDRLTGF